MSLNAKRSDGLRRRTSGPTTVSTRLLRPQRAVRYENNEPDGWQRLGAWMFPNVVPMAAFLTVYAWVCSYSYLGGFAGGFGTDLDQLGLDRSLVTARGLAAALVILPVYVLLVGLLVSAALFMLACVCVLAFVAIMALSAKSRRARWGRWMGGSGISGLRRNRTVLRSYLIFVLCFIAVCTPPFLNGAGNRDARRTLSQATFDGRPTWLQSFFQARAQPVGAHWTSPTPSPLQDAGGTSESAANGHLLGIHNGTTIFFNLDNCSIYYLPTGNVTLVEGIVTSPHAEMKNPPKRRC